MIAGGRTERQADRQTADKQTDRRRKKSVTNETARVPHIATIDGLMAAEVYYTRVQCSALSMQHATSVQRHHGNQQQQNTEAHAPQLTSATHRSTAREQGCEHPQAANRHSTYNNQYTRRKK